MDTDHSIVAHFVEGIPPVYLTFDVAGSGSINFQNGVIVTDALGTYTFDEGYVIYTTAVPYSGWSFNHWLSLETILLKLLIWLLWKQFKRIALGSLITGSWMG